MRKIKKYIPFLVLFVLMLAIHQYVNLYADDYYYSRDAKSGILKNLIGYGVRELNANGRIWVHTLLMILIKNDVILFRIINPIVITFGAYLIYLITKDFYENKEVKGKYIISILVCLFFVMLPKEIVVTTLYYPACALNYLYPSITAILYGYFMFKIYDNKKGFDKINIYILVIGFLAGSSTQQAGMIAIGFSVLNLIYIYFIKKYKINYKYILSLSSVFVGHILIVYGSLKRMMFESSTGVDLSVIETIKELLKSNIYSKPISIFVILMIISYIFNILVFMGREQKKLKYFVHLIILVGSLIVYVYAYRVKGHEIYYKYDENYKLLNLAYYGIFTLVYIFYSIYCSVKIYIKENNFFILSCIINAIGAQFMMIAADSRFASTYKIVFPSLMLLFIFISHAFLSFYNENTIKYKKVIIYLVMINLVLISAYNYRNNYIGYKKTDVNIRYNLEVIKKYNNSDNKETLTLKKIENSGYGYNLGNWNKMPYFMKQCYGISEDTVIEYIE